MREMHLLLLVLLAAGAALAMPGDVDEEGFCIDGDIVAGFCLGPQHSEEVMGTEATCASFCDQYREDASQGSMDRHAFFRDFTLLEIANYLSCEDQCLFEMFGFGNHTDGSIYMDNVNDFLDTTETGMKMDEDNVPENCLEASGEADYRDFFSFYAEKDGLENHYTEDMLEEAYSELSEEDRSNLDGIVEQMSFHECIKEMWSLECENTVNDFVRNAEALPVPSR